MTNKVCFGNVVTAMVTPFMPEDVHTVDLDGVELLANYLLKNGTDTILLTGSTGEGKQLLPKEKWDIVKRVRNFTPKGSSIMVATSDGKTSAAIDQAKTAFELGADSILVAVPEYEKPSQKALLIHFSAIAKAINGKPMMIYNIPGRTGKEILPRTVAQLADENPNIVGIKQSMGDMDKVTALKVLCPPNFQIYSGDDSLTLPMLALGAQGVVSVMSHLEGKLIGEMISEFKKGHVSQAQRTHLFSHPLLSHVTMHDKDDDYANPLPVKEALYQRGLISSPRARLLGEMSETAKDDMSSYLRQIDKERSYFYERSTIARKFERNQGERS